MEGEKILLCVDAKDVKQLTYTVFNVRKYQQETPIFFVIQYLQFK